MDIKELRMRVSALEKIKMAPRETKAQFIFPFLPNFVLLNMSFDKCVHYMGGRICGFGVRIYTLH